MPFLAILMLLSQLPFHTLGSLQPAKQLVFRFDGVRSIHVVAEGDGAGDLDCFILVGGKVVASDESLQDGCDIKAPVGIGKRATVWLKNTGALLDDFRITVEE